MSRGLGDVYKRQTFEGDAFFPKIDMSKWILHSSEKNNSSINQPYNYSFLTYTKIK